MNFYMKTSLLLLGTFFHLSPSVFSQDGPIGIFRHNKDIGNPKSAGAASYHGETQTYSITGSGNTAGEQMDGHRYLYNKVAGDFILTANFKFEGDNENKGRIGWMARSAEADDAVEIGGFLDGNGLTFAEWRESGTVEMQSSKKEKYAAKRFYEIIQLERKGNLFIVRAAQPGEPLEEIASRELVYMPEEVLAGIAIGSDDGSSIKKAMVWNVRIDQPVPEDYNPGAGGWIGCRLETMNVFDGKRQIIYEKDSRFEAPNWMPNGEKLLFNMDGLLYTIPVAGGEIEQLNTGFANDLNNDHCISLNGELLGISHNDGNGSNVFYLPLEGGEPKAVTNQAPSYLHGWAPNNKEVVYVATRKGNDTYDIYRKSIEGGKEVQLTDTQELEHVDGCEYSPDGKYIYYNGSQKGGTMQLWRMKPDGSEKEQLTFDEYNDWFPHISPDGKWIAFISFGPDIELNSHPSYKRVMLRMMPASGGAPKVIAHLYGGQGTINVNSWSPDSKSIAFVTNSGKEPTLLLKKDLEPEREEK